MGINSRQAYLENMRTAKNTLAWRTRVKATEEAADRMVNSGGVWIKCESGRRTYSLIQNSPSYRSF